MTPNIQRAVSGLARGDIVSPSGHGVERSETSEGERRVSGARRAERTIAEGNPGTAPTVSRQDPECASRAFLLFSLAIIFFLFALPVFAQVDPGLEQLAGTGLGTQDIRVTVASVIRTFLGLLGVVGVVLVLYGGFLWMTASGNEEQIEKAKKVLTNAAIGLVIVLSAFAITTFILNRLVEATTGQGPGAGQDGGGDLGGGAGARDGFFLDSVQPQGNQTIRNLTVRLFFSRSVNPTTVQGNVTIAREDDAARTPVEGTFATNGQTVSFVPSAPCLPDHPDRKCFEKDTAYLVEARGGADGVKSTDGKQLVCGFGRNCKFSFTSGNLVDVAPPTIDITNPANNQIVSADVFVPIDLTARDTDGGIAFVEVLVDGTRIGTAAPSGDTPKEWSTTIDWDTRGLAARSSHTIQARAFDVDDNSTDPPTEVSVTLRAAHCYNEQKDFDETDIDCGGADCGVCDGGACQTGNECASGTCQNNQCVAFPTITRVAPLDGAPGNFVTLFGRNFGSSPGTVTFLGASGATDDKPASAPQACGTGGMWTDTRVVVAVPDGVAQGPLKLTNAQNFWDTTANTSGVSAVFSPTTTVRPGLCRVEPDTGALGTSVRLTGSNFGQDAGVVAFGGTESGGTPTWTATQIAGSTVPNVASGGVDVVVRQGNEASNPVSFTVEELAGRPRIATIEPVSGPPQTFVTLRGEHFGSTGTVRFVNRQTGAETLGETPSSQACSDRAWTATAIVTKVPNVGAGAYDVRVVTKVGEEDVDSNSIVFTVNTGTLTPGVCALDPNNGPAGLSLRVLGERFGDPKGKVRFFDNQDDASLTQSQWGREEVRATVPLRAASGPVQLVDSTGTLSNKSFFTVRDCRSGGSCGQGTECCGDGSCRERGTCGISASACTYSWSFTTGIGGGGGVDDPCGSSNDCAQGLTCSEETRTCRPSVPQVVEQESCAQETQSPSPYRETKGNCRDAFIALRFTMNMHDGTLTNPANIQLQKCNTGETLNIQSCGGAQGLAHAQWIAHDDPNGEGAIYMTPALDGGMWYQVRVNGQAEGITSQGGILLDGDRDGKPGGDYVWQFHTRSSTESCTIDTVVVSPRSRTLTEPEAEQLMTPVPQAKNCNILNACAYSWAWSQAPTDRSALLPETPSVCTGPQAVNKAQARLIAERETDAGAPVNVTASVASGGQTKQGTGEITIAFPDPSVVEWWPQCSAACSNAEVGFRFSTAVDSATFGSPFVELFPCRDDACTAHDATPVPISRSYNPTTFTFRITPQASLRPETTWRVIVPGRVRSFPGGKLLGGLNFDTNNDTTNDAFSWTFRTKPAPATCTIASVEVEPREKTVYAVGLATPYSSVARGAPDACDPGGQRLNPHVYPWQWASTQQSVATVGRADIEPDGPNGRIDPDQDVVSQGQGKTTIKAQASGLSCNPDIKQCGAFELICGFTSARQCPGQRYDSAGNPIRFGVGDSGCCGARPRIIQYTPPAIQSGAQPICPNALLALTFDQVMQESSFVGNIQLQNSATKEFVRGSTEAVTLGGTTTVRFIPRATLDPDTQYQMNVNGGGFEDNAQDAIRNIYGIPLGPGISMNFQTKPEICQIAETRIIVAPPGAVRVADRFTCGRDDCPDDQRSGTAGNQHVYQAVPYDQNGEALVPGTTTWSTSGDPILTLTAQAATATTTSTVKNGEGEVTADVQGRDPAEGGAARTLSVRSFICENPWPSLATFPWRDDLATDPNKMYFELFYCRDAGEPGFDDDLPPLKEPVRVPKPEEPGVLKEFLLPLQP